MTYALNNKKIISLLSIAIFIIGILIIADPIFAQEPATNLIRQGVVDTGEAAELGSENTDFRIVIANLIRGLLSFLGIVFTILIIYGGFTWMTAGGNEENVAKAKRVITQASIGLIVVILAYAISNFVFNMIFDSLKMNI